MGKQNSFLKDIPEELTVFHWHGDMFEIPDNAINLFESDGCPNQAFQYGKNVLGFQFHFELIQNSLEQMLYHGAAELTENPYIQSRHHILRMAHYLNPLNKHLANILENLISGKV